LLRGFPNYLPVSDCQLSPPICCPDVLGKQGRALECLDELSAASLRCTDPAVESGLGRPCHRASKTRTWGTRRAALLRSGPASASAASVALGKCHPGGNASLQPSTAVLATRKPLMVTCGWKSQWWLYVCVVGCLVSFIVPYLCYI
jgi:hypothetical protein